MPNKRTFEIPPIRELMDRYCLEPGFEVFPFGPEIDVLERIKKLPDASRLTVLFDPPYSPRQAKENYNLTLDAVMFTNLLGLLKYEIARILAPGGVCISFGWNSNGIGKARGGELIEVLLVAHGASHNDTIVTVERKQGASSLPLPQEDSPLPVD